MKKLITKFIIVSLAALTFAGVSNYFSNSAKADILQVMISVNGQKPWTETIAWDNLLPGNSKKVNLIIKNIGTDPAKIWKKIKNVKTEENGIIEPEGEWYDAKGIDRAIGKNDVDSAIIYNARIGSNIIIDPGINTALHELENIYIYLGELVPEAAMTVEEGYELKNDAGNWMQSDRMAFDIEILALSLDAPTPNATTININELGADVVDQYAYNIDYTQANVSFTYDTPATGKLRGVINATGLKPFATYQVKFEGKPMCQYGAAGNDLANEYIGFEGRWTCVSGATCIGNAAARNRSDAQYSTLSPLRGNGSECITSYLVWGFFTADSNGNATKIIETTSSYHALFASGGFCGSTNNSHLSYLDPMHPAVLFAAPADVEGQIERGFCGSLAFNAGNYDLKIVLTEESFHQGNWATVLQNDINFTIQ